NSAKYLAENPDIAATLEKQLRDKLLSPAPDVKASPAKEKADDLVEVDV
ncbi:DNA recombination/repair protein RecA, partial [Pseudomonas neuropathica]